MEKKAVSRIVLILLLIDLITMVFSISPVSASLPVHNIDTVENFATIQEAIDDPDTLDGHTILVDSRTFYEHVTIDKSISLIGEDRYNTIIDGSGVGNVVYVTADNVNISGFTIQNSGLNWRNAGIFLGSSVGDSIRDNIMSNNYWGIHLEQSSMNNIISNNKMTSNLAGVYMDYDSPNNTIRNNMMSNNVGVTIAIFDSDSNVILNNTLTLNTGYILHVLTSSDTSIRNNTISDNDGGGIVLSECENTTVKNNEIVSNAGPGIHCCGTNDSLMADNNLLDNEFGVLLGDSLRNTITGNNISNNTWEGVGLENSEDNVIAGNFISNSLYGVLLGKYDHPSSNSKFYHNNLIDNTIQVWSMDSINVWDDGHPSGGNYWSDYSGVDADGDGIGDVPYVIDEDNQDNYPLMEPWSPLPRTIRGLITEIEELGSEGEITSRGIVKSLITKLNVAEQLVDMGRVNEAKTVLECFVIQVQRLKSIRITEEAADILIESAEYIVSQL